jgi:hypothetical protein
MVPNPLVSQVSLLDPDADSFGGATRTAALVLEAKTALSLRKNRADGESQLYKQAKAGDHCERAMEFRFCGAYV